MKTNILRISAFVSLLVASNVYADQTYVCTYGQQERVISIIYKDQDAKVPCDVRYTNNGETKTMWHADTHAGYCEKKAEEFYRKQIEWGWRCSVSNPSAINVNSPSEQQIKKSKVTASFTQLVAAVSSIKMQVIGFYQGNGKFPGRLEDIGLRANDMKTSSYIRDLKLGTNGEILIKGNEVMGLDTIVVLKPVLTLGGSSIEWQCSTNIDVDNIDYCKKKQTLTFK